MSEERCIHCGAVIPEGSMACKNCLLSVKQPEGYKETGTPK